MKLSEQFALNEWLSDYPENLSYEEIMDLLHGDSEEWTHEKVTVWQAVENFTLRQIAEFIDNTREHFARVTNEGANQ